MSDPIERQDAIDAFEDTTYTKNEIRRRITDLPSAQQDCTDCPEYDHETHFCPKYCETIRKTLEEAKQERTGRWVKISPAGIYECDKCGKYVMTDEIEAYTFCHGCGARMEGE